MATVSKLKTILQRVWIPILFLILILLDYSFRYFYHPSGAINWMSMSPALFTAMWAMGIMSVICAFRGKARRIIAITAIVLSVFICLLNAVMFNIFEAFFSFGDLAYAETGVAFFSFEYLKINPLEIICLILALVGGITTSLCIPDGKKSHIKLIACILIILLCIGGITTVHKRLERSISTEITWDNMSVTISDADAYHNLANTGRAMSASGIYQYMLRSFCSAFVSANSFSEADIDELDKYYSQQEASNRINNEMTGVFEGKNLIYIIMESIDSWMVTEEYMPNLYHLQQGGINFLNNFTPLYISAGTFCTEFVTNTGMIPPSTGIDISVYESNSFPQALGNVFLDAGYTTGSYHEGNPTFYNRFNTHPNWGLTAYYGSEEMGVENPLFDTEMLSAFEMMTDEEPFFSFVLTVSAHGPYTDDSYSAVALKHIEKARETVDIGKLPDSCKNTEEYIHAVAQAMETDEFIGGLYERLKSSGKLGNTVLILYSDHYAKYMESTEMLLDLKKAENREYGYALQYSFHHLC